jgi:hypothetical protein
LSCPETGSYSRSNHEDINPSNYNTKTASIIPTSDHVKMPAYGGNISTLVVNDLSIWERNIVLFPSLEQFQDENPANCG